MAKTGLLCVAVAVVLACTAAVGLAANTDSHTVTVIVEPINELAVVGGDVTILFTAAAAGAGLPPQSDISTGLSWTTNETPRKITVSDSIAVQLFPLTVQAQNFSGAGASTGVIPLTDGASADIVTGVGLSAATCQLNYTASPTLAAGAGTDVHTVTYALVAG